MKEQVDKRRWFNKGNDYSAIIKLIKANTILMNHVILVSRRRKEKQERKILKSTQIVQSLPTSIAHAPHQSPPALTFMYLKKSKKKKKSQNKPVTHPLTNTDHRSALTCLEHVSHG